MHRKILILTSLMILLTFTFVSVVQAAVTKYTFNDVDTDGMIVEIEASVKDNNKGKFSQCTYFSDDYEDALGYYSDAIVAGDTAEEVLAFCVEHFYERTG